jgi:hypothetical protein
MADSMPRVGAVHPITETNFFETIDFFEDRKVF